MDHEIPDEISMGIGRRAQSERCIRKPVVSFVLNIFFQKVY